MQFKKIIKKYLKLCFPKLLIYIIFLKRKILILNNVILSKYLHINLSAKRKGSSIVKKEKGFILSFLTNSFFTFHLRPKKAADFNNISTFIPNSNEFAIIIQGNIGQYFNYLIETIKIYKKIFPSTTLIVSTWDDEDETKLKKLNSLEILIIKNKKPNDAGWGNINLQLISTKAGLDLAKSKNINYCIKTRADCRIHKNDILPFLKSLILQFPIKSGTNSSSRIIASSLITCKYKIYGTTDIFLFGKTEDLLIYFDDTSFEESLKIYDFGRFPPLINGSPIVGETFLCARYLKKIGIKLDWTLDHWWECLRDYFCIIDTESIDLFWYKTDYQYEKRFLKGYSMSTPRCVSFSDWLALYSGNNMNWDKIKYIEQWEINKYSGENQDIYIKTSVF